MIGNKPQIKDVELDLDELILPQNLLTEESLSTDSEPDEEVELQPYKIDSYCTCKTGVRICVLASRAAINTVQLLLQQELRIICPNCAKNLRNGR